MATSQRARNKHSTPVMSTGDRRVLMAFGLAALLLWLFQVPKEIRDSLSSAFLPDCLCAGLLKPDRGLQIRRTTAGRIRICPSDELPDEDAAAITPSGDGVIAVIA